jgi:hypothetical protein
VRKALVVGISDYADRPLPGCARDALEVAELLETHADGTKNWDVDTLIGSTELEQTVTGDELRTAINRLLIGGGREDEELKQTDVLLYFAGHSDDSSGQVELIASDGQHYPLAVLEKSIDRSYAKSLTVVLDCCFSGGLGGVGSTELIGAARTMLREKATILTASRATEVAYETDGGAFSKLFVRGLRGGTGDILGRVTAFDLYAYVHRGFDGFLESAIRGEQRPQFMGMANEPLVLRHAEQTVTVEDLGALTHHFPYIGHRIKMRNEHEGDRPEDGRRLTQGEATVLQREFDWLEKLRNANMVTNDLGMTHWHMAHNNIGEVRLTALGRYFWRLADAGEFDTPDEG